MKRLRAVIFFFLMSLSLALFSMDIAGPAQAQQAELAFITSPANNEVVRGVISIRGSATHPSFDRFQVAYAREPVSGNNAWVLIGIERRDQVVNGELAIWDTRTVPDGSYSLRLRVVRNDANYTEIETNQIVVANTQPTETPTPSSPPTATITPTPLPATPTIVIEQPIVDTPTPRPLEVVGALPTPRPTNSGTIPIPNVIFDTAPLKSGCLWGGGAMLLLFLLFGFLSAFRTFVMGFADRTRGRRR